MEVVEHHACKCETNFLVSHAVHKTCSANQVCSISIINYVHYGERDGGLVVRQIIVVVHCDIFYAYRIKHEQCTECDTCY